MDQAVIAHFDVPGMTSQQYDRVIAELEEAGLGAPPARRVHVAGPTDDGWLVTDVWDSADDLQQFAQVLMPILVRNGVTPPQPAVLPVHALRM